MAFNFKALSSQNAHLSRFISRKSIVGTLIAGGAVLIALVSRGHAQSASDSAFLVEMSVGNVTAYFTAVSGLGSENEVIEHKIIAKGGKEAIIRMIPGRLKWNDIVLKRGISRNGDLNSWRKTVETGQVEKARLNVTLTAYDSSMTPIARWNVSNAWPKSLAYTIDNPADNPFMEIPSDSSRTAASEPVLPTKVETLVLVHEGVQRVY